MCSEVKNIYKQNHFTDDEINEYVNGVLSGDITPEKLDINLHYKSALILEKAVIKGYGKVDRLRKELVKSCYIFAAAKQHKLIIQILLDETKESGIKEFKRYYIDYFSAEIDSAEWTASGAKDFNDFIEWNKNGN